MRKGGETNLKNCRRAGEHQIALNKWELFLLFCSVVIVTFLTMTRPAAAVEPQIAAGGSHSIALKADGSLWAWGDNESGQVGDGTSGANNFNATPIRIGTATWKTIAGGDSHTMAVKANGTLWGWGVNSNLGIGSGGILTSPTQIGTDNEWGAIAPSVGQEAHTLGLWPYNGSLLAWGVNAAGQLGLGYDTPYPGEILTPTSTQIYNWVAIAAGGTHSVGLKADGTLWTWGSSYYGQLGNGDDFTESGNLAKRNTPIKMAGNYTWKSIAAGFLHTVVVKSDGTLWACGYNYYGQLGDGTNANKNRLTQIGTATTWVSVAAGQYHTLAVKADGTLWAWGSNGLSQLGDGTTADRNTPTQVGTDTNWVSSTAGRYHTLALKTDGTLWGWGVNNRGQVGDGTFTQRSTPVYIMTLADLTPDPFTFTNQTNVTLSTLITSNTIAVSGIDAAATISITGGEYQVNGGTWTTAPGKVNNGDTVAARQTSSSAYSTFTDAVLPIGGTTVTFRVTTVGNPAPVISSFTPSAKIGDGINIQGHNLADATVAFNGVAANVVFAGDTVILLWVPAGATTGPISVTTLGGTVTSTTNFVVTP